MEEVKKLIADSRKEHMKLCELVKSQIKEEKQQAKEEKLREAKELKLVKKAEKVE